MKKLIIFLSVFLFADVSQIVLKIKEIENIKKYFLPIKYNIFEVVKKEIETAPIIVEPIKKEIELKIYAIFNNKVNINGKWYKKGDFVNGYVVEKILYNKVILRKNSKVLVLKLKNNILKVGH